MYEYYDDDEDAKHPIVFRVKARRNYSTAHFRPFKKYFLYHSNRTNIKTNLIDCSNLLNTKRVNSHISHAIKCACGVCCILVANVIAYKR